MKCLDKYPKVYIVVLNFNSYDETKACITSVENITYDDYEIVIVDNHSNDNSYEILMKLYGEKYTVFKSQENLGYANGNNLGIKYALDHGAEYVCILNNDVEVEKDFLKHIIEAFDKDKSIGIAGPCICDYSDRSLIQAMGGDISLYTGLTQGKYKGMKYNEIPHENQLVDYIGGACFVCKREVFDKIGLIPENYFLFFEETEFCLKAENSGYKLLCIYSSKIYHKRSSTISKYSGLSYYFLNRNRVVFIRRNASAFQKSIFYMYIFIEAIGRMIIRKEPFVLINNILEGFKADVEKVDIKTIESILKKKN